MELIKLLFCENFTCTEMYNHWKQIFFQEEISSFIGISLEASRNYLSGFNNRINSYGFSLFDFEREYMNNYYKFNKIKKS